MTTNSKVNVQLKNIKTFQGNETDGLNADIYINGLKCLHIHDSGNGGECDYQSYEYNNKKCEQIKANIKALSEHIETLPDYQIFTDHPEIKIRMTLDLFVDSLLKKRENEKILRNLKAKEVDHVIYGYHNGDKYYLQKYKIPLSQIPTAILIAELNKIKVNNFKEGYVFFNTNLKELGIDVEKLI